VAQQPICPQCNTNVRPSWDWCMTCGFDPAGLKPAGWTPAEPRADAGADSSNAGMPANGLVPSTVSTSARLGPADESGTAAWIAPSPPQARATGRLAVHTAVTTLTGPGAAGPQEMHDPDWVQAPPRGKLSMVAMIGLLAVVVAAVGGLIVVTLLVLHRPIGTTDDGSVGSHPVPVTASP
jgi:hypothetical protein